MHGLETQSREQHVRLHYVTKCESLVRCAVANHIGHHTYALLIPLPSANIVQ